MRDSAQEKGVDVGQTPTPLSCCDKGSLGERCGEGDFLQEAPLSVYLFQRNLYFSRKLSAIIAMNSELVGFPRLF